MTDTCNKLLQQGTVTVDGRPFARFALGAADPQRDYGATLSLKIWPVVDGQGEPGWYETYQRVSAAIHAHVLSQN
jgi:hypothetical protein